MVARPCKQTLLKMNMPPAQRAAARRERAREWPHNVRVTLVRYGGLSGSKPRRRAAVSIAR